MYDKYLELLKKTGKTTYQVCHDVGISENTMSNWKKRSDNGGKLSVDNLAKLARYFNVPMEYFLE